MKIELNGEFYTPTEAASMLASVGSVLVPSMLRPLRPGVWTVLAQVKNVEERSSAWFELRLHSEDPAEPLGELYDKFHLHR